MKDRIKKYCEFSGYAKKDPDIMRNNISHGLVKDLINELSECIDLVQLLKDKPNEQEFIIDLQNDITVLEDSLLVYF